MKKEETKKSNIRNMLLMLAVGAFSMTLFSFFLPYYLKQEGLGILEIGALFSAGLAVGGFLISVIYSKILKRIENKQGLGLSIFMKSLSYFLFVLMPSSIVVLVSKISSMFGKILNQVSKDVVMQHDTSDKNKRIISSYSLILEGIFITLGILFSIFSINHFGFYYSFLIFGFITLFAMIFSSRVNDRTRFRMKSGVKSPKIPFKLKLVLFSELIYWFSLSASFALVLTFLITDRFAESFEYIGYLFIALYLSMGFTTLFTYKFLDRKDWTKTSILGMVILLLSAVVIIISNNNYWLVFSAMILEGIGAGIWVPSKDAIYWKLTPKEHRENVSGYFRGADSILRALGPLFGGFLVVQLGILAPFYFKVFASLVSILIYVYVLKK